MNKRRVVFCTHDCVYSSQILSRLLQHEDIEVVAVINSSRMLKPGQSSLAGALEFFSKTGVLYTLQLFAVTGLFSLLQPLSRLKNIHRIAKSNKIPFYTTDDINKSASVEFLKNHPAEFMLTAYFNQLIQPQVLNLPGMVC
ncbi:MAG: hypothetical protein EP297_13275, partial [Gammaproteobacteria bacterium]